MNKVNYQRELDQIIDHLQKEEKVPKLLMHSCCAPCSSYCLSYLAEYFHITIYYYNPNITEQAEYQKRVKEQQRLLGELPVKYPIAFVEGAYERCFACYELRQRKAAEYAKEHHFDYFTTTLSVSPHKNAAKLNEIGLRLAQEYGIPYLVSDFKKKGGYLKSIELSAEYQLYRQDYCGCVYSKAAREREKQQNISQL